MATIISLRHRLPALDGVRGIAILMVLGVHTDPEILTCGMVGVDLFFVLSGFLISSILLEEYRNSGTIHLGRFYLRRFLRLYPALVGVVLFVLVYTFSVSPERFSNSLADSARVLLYYFNWYLVWLIPDTAAATTYFTHLWSLSVEEQFYLIWPAALIFLLYLRISNRTMWWILLATIAVPSIARIAVWHLYHPHWWSHSLPWSHYMPLWIYFRTDLRIDALMWGVMLAWAIHQGLAPNDYWRRVLSPVSFIALAGLLVLACFNSFSNGVFHRGGMSVVGCLSIIVIAGAIWTSGVLQQTLALAPLCWLGRVSYGVYLWHLPLFMIAHKLPLSNWQTTAIGLSTTLAIASISYYGMELRFLRLKDRIGHSHAARDGMRVLEPLRS
jgi:peptidoglycan/LPS O-acetylase OafA/YrhL